MTRLLRERNKKLHVTTDERKKAPCRASSLQKTARHRAYNNTSTGDHKETLTPPSPSIPPPPRRKIKNQKSNQKASSKKKHSIIISTTAPDRQTTNKRQKKNQQQHSSGKEGRKTHHPINQSAKTLDFLGLLQQVQELHQGAEDVVRLRLVRPLPEVLAEVLAQHHARVRAPLDGREPDLRLLHEGGQLPDPRGRGALLPLRCFRGVRR